MQTTAEKEKYKANKKLKLMKGKAKLREVNGNW
jgi:hypothetical protein